MAGVTRSPQRELLRLRARLTWRRYTAQSGRIVWAGLSIIILLPLLIGLGVATWFGYTHLPQPWPFQLLGGVFAVMWVIWLVFPVLFAPLNEGIDLERLLIYPLRPRDLGLSAVLGTVFDYTTYFTWPLFIAALFGFGLSLPLLPVVLLAIVLVYAHMVLTSQLILTAFGGVLQSRRFRDVAVVIASFTGFACWGLSQAMQSVFGFVEGSLNPEAIQTLRPLNVLQWLPPGAAARAIERAANGDWVASLVWLAYVALLLVLIGLAWTRLINRLMTGHGFWLTVSPREERAKARRPARGIGVLGRLFSAETLAITAKEYRSAWRIPQRRIGTLQGILLPFILLGFTLFNSSSADGMGNLVTRFFPFYILLTFWIIGQNMLGWEHRGLPMLLITPVRRRHIFLGKILALATLSGVPYAILGVIFAVLNREPADLLWLVIGLAMGLNALAVLSATSVWFPLPVRLDFKRGKNARSSGGCFPVIGNMVVGPLGIGVVNLPLLALFAVDFFFPDLAWIVLPAAPLALLYALLLVRGGAVLAERQLLQREPEVLETVKPVESD